MSFSVKTMLSLLATAGVVWAHAGAQPGDLPEKRMNGGCEGGREGGLPPGWTVLSIASGAVAESDSMLPHGGEASLHIHHPGGGSTVVASSPLRLQVGHLYRLTGWLRTENARVDPSSRYPTGVAGTVSMESFPFTNHSPALGGSRGWTRVEELFFATRAVDRVLLHLGHNADATGSVWFDDLSVEEVDDIAAYLPPERVRWHGPAFRYDDNGWIVVHIEGQPYTRGYQYGRLLAAEIAAYQRKLAVDEDNDNPKRGWDGLRTMTDAMMLRGFDEEYLMEMRGIADGAAAAGARFEGREPDLLDIVTVNSAVDLGQLRSALSRTANPLSGRSFRAQEEEAAQQERLHKCSSFLANGPATADGRIVFSQIFMWGGYTGVHWNVICDVVPSRGHRLVYQTFPGGIHSGADFYINDAGIMIGETTVMQTPFNPSGTPQSARIRKAAQYAESIDDVVQILTTGNNGLYTNDWLIGDTRRNEIGILLLGTTKHKLWRSSAGDFPGGTSGFYWSVNNAKDPEVRKEYVPNASNAPFDVVFSPVNRDLSFVEFYRARRGAIDAPSAARLLASSPVNRPHACDGKVTTSEMAAQLMFQAHYGKVTLREKFPAKDSRRMPDLPEAIPHLTQGYTIISPVFVAEKLKASSGRTGGTKAEKKQNPGTATSVFRYPEKLLWHNSVFPATEADNWFVSGSAAYWKILQEIPESPEQAAEYLSGQLAEMSCRLSYVTLHEKPVVPLRAVRSYDGYANYIFPRIRGTFLLHQLRLTLGNEVFARFLDDIHTRFRETPVRTADVRSSAERLAGRDLGGMFRQWLERSDMPALSVAAFRNESGGKWQVQLIVLQHGAPYSFITTVATETENEVIWNTKTISGTVDTLVLEFDSRPVSVTFNAGNDIPLPRKDCFTFSSYFDDFASAAIVYGTAGRIEANHTLALRWQTTLADLFTEVFTPVVQDAEMDDPDRGDVLVLGSAADNSVLASIAVARGLELGRDMFRWQGELFADPEDGLFVALAHPRKPDRPVYLFVSNSALQLYNMTRRYQSLPSWAVFRGGDIVKKGYHPADGCRFELD